MPTIEIVYPAILNDAGGAPNTVWFEVSDVYDPNTIVAGHGGSSEANFADGPTQFQGAGIFDPNASLFTLTLMGTVGSVFVEKKHGLQITFDPELTITIDGANFVPIPVFVVNWPIAQILRP